MNGMSDSEVTAPPIRIVVVDDHEGVRAGLIRFFDNEDDMIVVGEGATGQDALQLVHDQEPDVLLLDVEIPLIRGNEVVKQLHDMELGVKVLAVSSYDDAYHIFGMLEMGANGYITKDEVPEHLLTAVRCVATESPPKWVSPRVKQRLHHDDAWRVFILR